MRLNHVLGVLAFASLCLGAVLIGVGFANAIQVQNYQCVPNTQCKTIGPTDSSNCDFGMGPTPCDFSGNTTFVDICIQNNGQACGILGTTVTPQTCNGFCTANPTVNCSVSWNKCG